MMPPRSTRKQQSRGFKRHGEPFQKRKPVNYHPIENMTIGSNYDRMPPTLSIAKVYPLSRMSRRSSTSTSRIISTKAILWHRRPDTDPQHFTVKKKDGSLRIVHDYRKLNEYTVLKVTTTAQNIVNPPGYQIC